MALSLAAVIIFCTPLAVLAETGSSKPGSRPAITIAACTVVPVLAILVYGLVVLAQPVPEPVSGVRLRLVQPSIPQIDKFDPEKRREIFRRHLELSRRGAGAQAH